MKQLGINYVNACSGGLSFRILTDEGEIQRRADTIEDGVYWMQRYGWTGPIWFSSDMDFASEYGFADDKDAIKMFDEIMERATAK